MAQWARVAFCLYRFGNRFLRCFTKVDHIKSKEELVGYLEKELGAVKFVFARHPFERHVEQWALSVLPFKACNPKYALFKAGISI